MSVLRRLYEHRELIGVLIARELKIRYRGAVLGFLWSFLSPLIMMSVYVLLFSVYMRVPVANYPAFVLTGLLPWFWFSSSVGEATGIIIANGSLVKKVRLPPQVFPLVTIGAHFVHFALSVPLLLAFLVFSGVGLAWTIVWLPVILLVQFVFTFGVALAASSLAVRFRDLLHLTPHLLTIWLFLSPIFYPVEMVPQPFHVLLAVNPMAHVIMAIHEVLLRHVSPDAWSLGLAAAMALLTWGVGHVIFAANQAVFAEEV